MGRQPHTQSIGFSASVVKKEDNDGESKYICDFCAELVYLDRLLREEWKMLKVTDMNRLKEYGFEKMGKNRSGRDIWNLQIESGDFELCLTVNPLLYDRPEIDGEIVLWGNVDVKYKDAADSFAKYGWQFLQSDRALFFIAVGCIDVEFLVDDYA
jgi:hypothetical protein